jgi:hypothetical protein
LSDAKALQSKKAKENNWLRRVLKVNSPVFLVYTPFTQAVSFEYEKKQIVLISGSVEKQLQEKLRSFPN